MSTEPALATRPTAASTSSREVTSHADGGPADLRRDLARPRLVEVGDDDVRALGGEPARGRGADPARAAGDDRVPAVEAHARTYTER